MVVCLELTWDESSNEGPWLNEDGNHGHGTAHFGDAGAPLDESVYCMGKENTEKKVEKVHSCE